VLPATVTVALALLSAEALLALSERANVAGRERLGRQPEREHRCDERRERDRQHEPD